MPTQQKLPKFNPRNVNQLTTEVLAQRPIIIFVDCSMAERRTLHCSRAGFVSFIKNFIASSSVLSHSDYQCRLFKPEHNDSAVNSLSNAVDMVLWTDGKQE